MAAGTAGTGGVVSVGVGVTEGAGEPVDLGDGAGADGTGNGSDDAGLVGVGIAGVVTVGPGVGLSLWLGRAGEVVVVGALVPSGCGASAREIAAPANADTARVPTSAAPARPSRFLRAFASRMEAAFSSLAD